MNRQCFGVIIGVRRNPPQLIRQARADITAKLDELGYDVIMLSEDTTPDGAVNTYEDSKACAELFKANGNRISGIVVVLANFGMEVGVADAIEMSGLNVPILVQAIDDDFDLLGDCVFRRDSFCGKISVCNNLRQRGIPFTLTKLHTCRIDSQEFTSDLTRFAGVCRVVGGLRGARIGLVGIRPNHFNTVRYSEKILQMNKIAVQTIDLAMVLDEAENMVVSDEVRERITRIKAYAPSVEGICDDLYALQAKLWICVEKALRELDCDAYAMQCYRSVQYAYGCSACLSMSLINEFSGIPAACESDVTGAISMLAAKLASGNAPALLDWDNNIREDRNRCISLHCSNFPKSFFQNDVVLSHQALWKARGEVFFGTVEGQVASGDMTFVRISTDDVNGVIRAYVGEGRFDDEYIPAAGGIASCRVENLQELMRYICRNGYEHHVCMVRGRAADILEEALTNYIGIAVYRHR